MNLEQFGWLMEQRAKRLPAAVNKLKRDVALDVLMILAEITPVDTGAAVSNWVVKLDMSPGAVIIPHAPGRYGSTRTENIRATISVGVQVIQAAQPKQTIYITNSLPYIKDLNSGTSGQAPAGFVETAVIEGRRLIRSAKVIDI